MKESISMMYIASSMIMDDASRLRVVHGSVTPFITVIQPCRCVYGVCMCSLFLLFGSLLSCLAILRSWLFPLLRLHPWFLIGATLFGALQSLTTNQSLSFQMLCRPSVRGRLDLCGQSASLYCCTVLCFVALGQV